ncbi:MULTISPECIES: ATP-dependent DNA ligase [unclassified Curtobacterium]|uniref:DUF7882 family protein n=1 Tax=unclassified Curtobacterium TaxID=257496 RepID=UPI000DA7E31E|nr:MULTISPECIES: ATP-dependent DNA ligase [unclassified Curtobacterium]PZE26541.1 ATP-dependent DNA ligase [Curtobacterium sp. MCBD17_028]PZE74288.1 ATP-dependent DNA ligase [Curtobacterium sp. MCBD17_019]PZF58631.1 ATP-dependent DNA ligase [Curtobacterium sp. MCBD17_034]PZF64320.1 ATP-dependent DNA ligase [Curtobacterium sp. MCBD17_013]PZM34621.1 ATP-dependent DNA ligase [Curtobacterium sp. MCBD17_031]
MGHLTYGAMRLGMEIEDRTLAHLQVVIVNRLRRGDSFAFSWKDDVRVGDGRTTIWLHPYCELHFKFIGGRPPRLNRAWIAALDDAAGSGTGLYLLAEPPEGEAQTRRPELSTGAV